MRRILRELKKIWSRINSSDPYNGVMRIAARVSIGVACLVIGKIRGSYDGAPCTWLSHYLIGDGSPRWLTGRQLDDLPVLDQIWEDIHPAWTSSRKSRFANGPFDLVLTAAKETFYVVGGMTVRVEKIGNRIIVSGTDHYDWRFSGDEYNNGMHVLLPYNHLSFLFKVTCGIWPLFDYHADIMNGRISIYDSFWSYLGGKEFDTLVEFELPAGELDTALQNDS